MQGIFQKENTDKALKYGIYRHLPTYEKIIRNLVSFYARKPRNPKLIALKNRLNELGYHPTIAHEYVTEDRVWHSYFSITTDGVIG